MHDTRDYVFYEVKDVCGRLCRIFANGLRGEKLKEEWLCRHSSGSHVPPKDPPRRSLFAPLLRLQSSPREAQKRENGAETVSRPAGLFSLPSVRRLSHSRILWLDDSPMHSLR